MNIKDKISLIGTPCHIDSAGAVWNLTPPSCLIPQKVWTDSLKENTSSC